MVVLGSDIGGVRLNAFPDVELCHWAILVYFSLLSKLTWIATSPALRKYRLRGRGVRLFDKVTGRFVKRK